MTKEEKFKKGTKYEAKIEYCLLNDKTEEIKEHTEIYNFDNSFNDKNDYKNQFMKENLVLLASDGNIDGVKLLSFEIEELNV